MMNLVDFYATQLTVDTPIGECRFIKVKEYPKYFLHLNALQTTKDMIIYNYYQAQQKAGMNRQELDSIVQEMNKFSLYEMVCCSEQSLNLYTELFALLFGNPDAFSLVKPDDFLDIRKLIMDMSCIKEEKVNPNPVIQAWIDKSKRFHAGLDEDKLTYSDIIVASVAFTGIDFPKVNEWSVYNLYLTFHQIAQYKTFDTMTLFATVSTEKLDIQNWCKHIDLLIETDKASISKDEYDKQKKSLGFSTQTSK